MVLDTSAVVAAMRSPTGASAALLRAARKGDAVLLANVALALEYEATCRRAEHRLASGLAESDVVVFVDALLAMVEPVESHFIWRPQLRDPSDELVLEAAVNGRAQAIVTFNRRDFGEAPLRFGVEVLAPAKALHRIST
ncbi:MAG: putative toxin-antitoxin system toxin component, PIN family [Rudaea sp.]|uniref:putative toxin-antitoxin system toxin component, PIN family n=1 Tax=Rudaea sp. TaxID=2136325 RepID=UPI0039E2C7D4